ncbi:IS1634 family transposase [Marivirga sp.]|uniref:IS1634 family transposase n=1 Tax=Marivirga sp. TaxID=2018662 RepID=UPI002D7ECE20|nr:IS1634 family transposase [Marivirga sp.]HET8861073.1 IS1634 family transposase [Marivirga sp.]
MFVRKKYNPSGVTSVQVIDKSTGKYVVKKTIGSSKDENEVNQLVSEGYQWIQKQIGQEAIDFTNHYKQAQVFLDQISEITISGVELLLGRIYNEIGFDQIDSPLFKPLVLSRIESPSSKLKTTDYLFKYHSMRIDVEAIYRYMDKLYNKQKEKVQQISYNHTREILGEDISMVFYDVTTLYFEIEKEDELRKNGFSKDGKHQHPQIVLGLLVSVGGYPLAYEIFEGNKYEGNTMLPIIEAFKRKYKFKNLTVVADSGLINNENIKSLEERGYKYILGARIKNQPVNITKQIHSFNLNEGESKVIWKDVNTALIINYSSKRARKDLSNRQRGLKRLEKQIASGKLTKSNINKRGYNKYLKMEGQMKVSIDKEKFESDDKWDGLKGYQTNHKSLSKEEVIENYQHLWRIEKAFRISKHDLKIRPIYHRLEKRIEAHICLCFAAYKVYKELERQLNVKEATISAEKAINIAKTIYNIKVNIPETNQVVEKTIITNEEQKYLTELFKLI